MADRRVVLSDVLCFVKYKYGKTPSRLLRTALTDFYSGEVLSSAKQQLLDDIASMNISSVKLPHVPRRREKDNKATRETDDIFLLLSCLDENKLIDSLPRYVSDNPDSMPSIRIYEGDFQGVVKMLHGLNEKVEQFGSMFAILSRDIREVQSRITPPGPGVQPGEQPRLSRLAQDTYNQQSQQPASLVPMTSISRVPSLSEFPPVGQSSTTVTTLQPVDQGQGRDWATLASTPFTHANRFAPLLSTEDDDTQDEQLTDDYTVVKHRKNRNNKRGRVESTPQAAANRQDEKSTRRAPVLLGKSSTSGSKLAAAQDIRKKSVFCVDNVNTSCNTEDIRAFVANSLSIEVLSCFEVKPRRRRGDDQSESAVNRKAFRLCICAYDRDRLLDASVWPKSVVISDWFFKKQSEEDKRMRMDTETVADDADVATAHRESATVIPDDNFLLETAGAGETSHRQQETSADDDTVIEIELSHQ